MDDPKIMNGSQASRLHMLNYAAGTVSEPVVVARCRTTMEASMLAQMLSDAGITAQLTDQNTEVLGPYAAGASVRVIVPSQDAALAQEALKAARETQGADVEPVDVYACDQGMTTVAAFEQAWQMKEAAVTLVSARIETFVPQLVARGESAAGAGRRFILRVSKSDADEARNLLRESDFDADDRRCSHCGCQRIVEEMGLWQFFLDLIFIVGKRREYTCVGCRHRGGEAEFRETNWLQESIVE